MIAAATGHFIANYLLAVAYRALGFGSHFMLKYPDDYFWGFCGLQLRNGPQDGTSVSGVGTLLKEPDSEYCRRWQGQEAQSLDSYYVGTYITSENETIYKWENHSSLAGYKQGICTNSQEAGGI